MPHHHHRNAARSADELVVCGNYLEISITRILLDVTIKPLSYGDELKKLILFETICTNLWEYRLRTFFPAPVLIDSKGFQHSDYSLNTDSIAHKSKHLRTGTAVSPVADVIEGQAKSRGWIAFPYLGKSIVPYRLIFQIQTFDPGQIGGSVRDSETLELIFDLSLLGRLLGNGAEK
jgi:hypothetical protein